MTYFKKYAVSVWWNTDNCECHIYHPTKSDLEHDGDNYVSRGGSEGMHFDIYDNIETALVKCAYNPKKIKFHLNNKSMNIVKKILKQYTWNTKTGLVKREN